MIVFQFYDLKHNDDTGWGLGRLGDDTGWGWLNLNDDTV